MTEAKHTYSDRSTYSSDNSQKYVTLTRDDGLTVSSGWWPCDGSAEQEAWERMRARESITAEEAKRRAEPKLYADRDIISLDKAGNFYSKHVSAMTREGLHSKSDIAAELAFRDYEIERLRAELKSHEETVL